MGSLSVCTYIATYQVTSHASRVAKKTKYSTAMRAPKPRSRDVSGMTYRGCCNIVTQMIGGGGDVTSGDMKPYMCSPASRRSDPWCFHSRNFKPNTNIHVKLSAALLSSGDLCNQLVCAHSILAWALYLQCGPSGRRDYETALAKAVQSDTYTGHFKIVYRLCMKFFRAERFSQQFWKLMCSDYTIRQR